MGGRGANSGGASRAPNGYRTVGRLGKISAIRGNNGQGLPSKAAPKSKMYRIDKSGRVSQYRQYDKKGNALKDIDWEHGHNGIPRGTPHIHDWENGVRGDGRRLTPSEIKKYKNIIDNGMRGK